MEKIFSKKIRSVILKASMTKVPERYSSEIDSLKEISSLPIRKIDINELAHLHKYSPKDLRLYSKATLLALEGLYDLEFQTLLAQYDKDRTGIYVAGSWGKINPDIINASHVGILSPTGVMKSHFPPKYDLKHFLGILPGHLSIHFGIRGPTNCFLNANSSLRTAIEKSQLDLACGYIDLAVVVGINIYDEITIALGVEKSRQNSVLNEAAAVYILNKSDISFKLNRKKIKEENFYDYIEDATSEWTAE